MVSRRKNVQKMAEAVALEFADKNVLIDGKFRGHVAR